MGVHTGDSIVVAPIQTLPDPVVQRLRRCALKIVRALRARGRLQRPAGGLAGRQPTTGSSRSTRASRRSSALASQGDRLPDRAHRGADRPGRRLHEMPNPATGGNSAAFEPAVDYVVVKLPRWPFDKFPTRRPLARGPDEGHRRGDGHRPRVRPGPAQGDPLARAARARLAVGGPGLEPRATGGPTTSRPSWRRPTRACGGWSASCATAGPMPPAISAATGIAPWFTERLAELVEAERAGRRLAAARRQARRLRRRRHRDALRRARRWPSGARGCAPASAPPTGGSTPAPASSRPRRRTSTQLRRSGGARRRPSGERDRRRLRTDPHRAGDRVRLLQRARGVGDPRDGPRRGRHQQQPRDVSAPTTTPAPASTSSRSTPRACSTSSTTSGR